MQGLRSFSPKWLSTFILFLLWLLRGFIEEWIFGNIVERIRNLGWGIGVWEFLARYSEWVIGGIILIGIILSIIWASIDTRNRWVNRKLWLNKRAWEVYDNLCELFRELTHTKDEKERASIHSHIENERGKLPDKRMDEMIKLFLGAEAERARFGLNPYTDDAQYMLSLNNERMRNHIRGKYGERKPETENNL